uniref:G_PROTEIN_RECEP_F1_2 domain-containing protein n=1 Tax=Schistosoma mansoni TaxID=6183 RepID=A0A5K4F5P8_SCHMA
MIEDVCYNSKLFTSKSLDFILTNSQLSETNVDKKNHFLNKYDNFSILLLNDYIKNLTEKLKGIQLTKSQLYICNIIHLLWMYIPPILFIFGSLGNVLSFIILRHISTGSVTIILYLIARSIVDEIVLIVGLLRRWIDKIFDTKFENTSNFMCKMIHFWGTSSSLLSVWLTVSLTAERALVVSFPLHVTRWISYTRVRNMIIILSILCVILSLHFYFTVGITSNCLHELKNSSSSSWLTTINQTIQINLTIPFMKHKTQMKCFNQCTILPQYSILNWYWSSFDAILYSYLPFCLIFGFNIIILKSVYRANKERKHLHIHQYKLKYSRNHDSLSSTPSILTTKSIINHKNIKINETNYNIKQLTIILLIISFLFLFTTFFIVLIKILAQIIDLRGKNKLNIRINFYLIDNLSELFMYINHSMNFYLFCITGKLFRKYLLLLLFNQIKQIKFYFNQLNLKNYYHDMSCSHSNYFSCLSLCFNNTNNNEIFNQVEINQIHTRNYENNTILLNTQRLNLCEMSQVNEAPSIQDKSTIMEIISYRLYTPLLNNSYNILFNQNIEDTRDSSTNNNNTCLPKSRDKLYNDNNNNKQLTPTISHFSKIGRTRNQHYYDSQKQCHHDHQQQQQLRIDRNLSFDENKHNIEDNQHLDIYLIDEIKYSTFKSLKRQTSRESLQTI